MSDEACPVLRSVTPWLRRAEETAAVDRRISYYLRLRAVQEGLKLGATGGAGGAGGARAARVIRALLDTLESDKRAAGLQGAAADGAHCAAFANKVFSRADARVRGVEALVPHADARQDRAGERGLETAQAFAAAACFFELLTDFEGALGAEAAAKQAYASFRSSELTAALRGSALLPAPPPHPPKPAEGPPSAPPAPEAPPEAPPETPQPPAAEPRWGEAAGLVAGAAVLYRESSCAVRSGVILAVDFSSLPPSYLVQLRADADGGGGEERDTVAERLALADSEASEPPWVSQPFPHMATARGEEEEEEEGEEEGLELPSVPTSPVPADPDEAAARAAGARAAAEAEAEDAEEAGAEEAAAAAAAPSWKSATAAFRLLRSDDVAEAARELRSALRLLTEAFPQCG